VAYSTLFADSQSKVDGTSVEASDVSIDPFHPVNSAISMARPIMEDMSA